MGFFGKPQHSRNIEETETDWLNHARGKTLPYRGDFDLLNNDFQFLLERDEAGEMRLRRVGLYFEALFGASLAGRSFTTLFSEPHRMMTLKELEPLFEGPSKIFMEVITADDDMEIGLFPVCSDYGPVDFAVGAVSLEALPEHNVTSLGLRSVEVKSLREEQKELRYGFAEDRAGFGGAPRAQFTLITGGGESAPVTRPGLKVIKNVKREP